MNKRTLEISFMDSGSKPFRISINNPKDNIEAVELTDFESYIVENDVFVGKAGKIKGFGTAVIREVTETDLLR
jgi:hypothetical protein